MTLSFMLQRQRHRRTPRRRQPPAAPTLELTPTTPPYANIGGIPVTNSTDADARPGRRPPGPPSRSPRPGPTAPAGRHADVHHVHPAGLGHHRRRRVRDVQLRVPGLHDTTGSPVTNGTFQVSATATYNPPYDTLGRLEPPATSSPSRSTTRRRPRSATSASFRPTSSGARAAACSSVQG